VVALLLAAGVAVALGVVGRRFGRASGTLPTFGFSDTVHFKAWLASAVLVLAVAQLITALWLYRRLPGAGRAPGWLPRVHRLTGAVAFILSLPVAFYCLYSFGFAPAPTSTRTLIHSLAGCAFYGAFAAKVLLVHTRRLPNWALPVAGGLILTIVVVIWLTSSLWLFRTTGVHG
jgi:hypothetical protein